MRYSQQHEFSGVEGWHDVMEVVVELCVVVVVLTVPVVELTVLRCQGFTYLRKYNSTPPSPPHTPA
jgi:hypothetical protein